MIIRRLFLYSAYANALERRKGSMKTTVRYDRVLTRNRTHALMIQPSEIESNAVGLSATARQKHGFKNHTDSVKLAESILSG